MTGRAALLLPVGLALAGAVLATTGLPLPGSPAGRAAVAPAVAEHHVTVAAPVMLAAVAPSTSSPTVTDRAHAARARVRVVSLSPTGTVAPRTAPAARRPSRTPTATRTAGSTCSGAGWQQRRGQAALRSLQPAAGNGYGLRFMSARPGFYGLTRPSLGTVEVYVRTCSRETDELLRHVLAHELGHAYDKTRLTNAQRSAYKAARGIPASTPWFGCSRCTDFATPAGDFAEVYSQWRRGATTNLSRIGNAPSRAQLDVLAKRFFGA